jgi:uncharacterized protein YjcR
MENIVDFCSMYPSMINSFVETYFELKKDGYTDKEIGERLGVCKSTIGNWKRVYGITGKMRSRKNSQGLSFEELRIADENGIGRRLALQRVRAYGWSNKNAITAPKGRKKSTLGKSKHERQLEKSDRQRQQYKNRKNS